VRVTLIQTKIADIQDNLHIVKQHLPQTVDQFRALGIIKDGIYKKIEFCIEIIYDICAVVNTDLQLGIPEGDESIIDHLHKQHILSLDLSETLKDMKGFRNILVHRYGRIDDDIAFTILSSHMNDFYRFIDEINVFLNNQKNNK